MSGGVQVFFFKGCGDHRALHSFPTRRSGDLVTAGMYLVSERVRTRVAPAELGRLREFLGWLCQAGEPLFGEVVETVVDVDRAGDVAIAEALALAGRVS